MPAKRQTTLTLVKAQPADGVQRATRKRSRDEANEATASVTPVKKLKGRSKPSSRALADPPNIESNLVDSVYPGLILVMIGLNPGLQTAFKGHAYAHPSNLYWRLLHWSGITPRLHAPSETHDLPGLYQIGNTNICFRPTRNGAGLSKEELLEGAQVLDEKIARYKPEAVCIVGKSIWEAIYKSKTGKPLKGPDFHYGWQDEKLWLGRPTNKAERLLWPGSKTFVATTTSALAANMSTDEKLKIWKPLGEWVQQKRKEALGTENKAETEGGSKESKVEEEDVDDKGEDES